MSTTLPSPLGDADLLARFRAGDASSFDGIVRNHRSDLYRVALRILGRHERADEAVQEAFLRAWRALDRFRGEAALKTWLTRIVINVSRTMLRPDREMDELPSDEAVRDPSEDAEAVASRVQARGRVRAAVAGLPPRQREVVWLKVFCEMTHGEVASAMGITEGAAKAHLHQAVANLRRRMAGNQG
jgi:RNA polymerase sigma-70 factor (ECF subfamily)